MRIDELDLRIERETNCNETLVKSGKEGEDFFSPQAEGEVGRRKKKERRKKEKERERERKSLRNIQYDTIRLGDRQKLQL